MPPRDYEQLATSFRRLSDSRARSTRQEVGELCLGMRRTFWLADLDCSGVYQITATLRALDDHVQMWVEEGVDATDEDIERSAAAFADSIYPTNRCHFGSEWTPGIDGDSRIVVLNARIRGASGYFGGANEYPRSINPYSNEAEIIFVNADAVPLGSDTYEAVLAHEFQHMIHWHQDGSEEAWLNEGASELAEMLNGYSWSRANVQQFERNPDLQLNTWAANGPSVGAHYGASFLIMRYFSNRCGPEALRGLVQDERNGIASFGAILAKQKPGLTFAAFFADWLVANLMDKRLDEAANLSPEQDARYRYPTVQVQVVPRAQVRDLPYKVEDQVQQFGADYYGFDLLAQPIGQLSVVFQGQAEVAIVPTLANSGLRMWWSNRGDAGHSYLRRSFDLTNASAATMSFMVWHDIEYGWDYAYLRVSTDGGVSWIPLRTERMPDYDPVGNALAAGYTGRSGAAHGDGTADAAQWVRERIDLTPYCGNRVVLQFDYVTDDAVNGAGLCLDDVTLDVVDYATDFEDGRGGWEANGFVWTDNRLAQRYSLQAVFVEHGGIRVQPIKVAANGAASAVLDATDGTERVVLIVAAITPHSWEPAAYRLEVRGLAAE